MEEKLGSLLMPTLSAIVGVLGFFLSRFISGTDKTKEKVERTEEKTESEIVTLKITLERMNSVLTILERDMKAIAEDAKLAASSMRMLKDLQEDIIKNKGGLEAAWKAIEELRYDIRKRDGELVLARGRKARA